MCPSSTRASSRSLAVWMALPRSGNRKYILRLMRASSPKHDSPTFLPCGTPEVKPSMSRCGKIADEAGQTVAGKCFTCQRKVRAPQSRVLGNAQAPRGDEEGHRDESGRVVDKTARRG